jgi:parallel beta-helix repeat protein
MHVTRMVLRFGVLPAALCVVSFAARVARCDSPDVKPAGPSSREVVVGPPRGGDGRDADQRELQDAIDRLAATGGGTVRVTPGRYVLRAALTLRDHVRILGTPGRTVLASCDGASARLTEDARHDGDRRIAVEDAGAFRAGDGVAIKDDAWPSAFGVTTATLEARIGSRAFRLSAPPVQDYAVKRNATLVHAFPVVGGWNVQGAVVEGITVDGNHERAAYLDGCRGAGIYLYACKGITIRDCTVRNCRGDGISFQWASQDVTVEDCLVEKCGVFGLHPGSDSHHSVVRRNRSVGNGGPGLFVCESVKHVLFERNELRDNLGPGISIGCRDTDNVFRANSIKGNGVTGILFRDDGGEEKGAHRNTVENNAILDNGSPGKPDRPPACITILGTHRNLVFRNNTIGNTQPGGPATVGLLVESAPDLEADANQFLNLKERTSVSARPAPGTTR